MRENYGLNKKRREEAKRKHQQEKREKRFNKSKGTSEPETGSTAPVDPTQQG